MAFGDITVSNGTVSRVFTPTKSDGQTARRIDNATTVVLPTFLDLKHQEEGKVGTAQHRDRHLISLRRTEKDAVTGELNEAVINCTIVIPRTGVITRAMSDEMTNVIRNFLVTANLDKLYRGEL